MSKLLTLQEPFIVWLQTQLHPQADTLFQVFTYIGSMEISFFIWGFFMWSLSYSFGCRLVLLWLLSSYIALTLKNLVASPRPFQVSAAVIPIITEKGFGFPSGHTLSAVITWGYFSLFARKILITLLALFLIFFIGLSRIYLGVHYPMDVVGSWVLGISFLLIFIKAFPLAEKLFERKTLFVQLAIILAGAATVLMLIHAYAPPGTFSRWVSASFVFYLSFCVGWFIHNHFVKCDTSGSWYRKMLRFFIGALVLLGAMYFSRKGFWYYTFAGLWLPLGAPALFKMLRL